MVSITFVTLSLLAIASAQTVVKQSEIISAVQQVQALGTDAPAAQAILSSLTAVASAVAKDPSIFQKDE